MLTLEFSSFHFLFFYVTEVLEGPREREDEQRTFIIAVPFFNLSVLLYWDFCMRLLFRSNFPYIRGARVFTGPDVLSGPIILSAL